MVDATRSSLRKQSRLPLSLKVKYTLRARLERGEWPVGTRIPTLEQLMQAYGVSRATMRAALDELEREGLIERTRGKGTFVIGDVAQEHWLALPTCWDELLAYLGRLNTVTVELGSGKGGVPTDIAGAAVPDTYWWTMRVNHADGLAYSMSTVYVLDAVAWRLQPDLCQGPVLLALDRLARDQIHAASQTLTVRVADADLARHLNMDIGMPVVRLLRTVRNQQGQIVYAAQVYYPAQYLSITTELSPSSTV
ncbi:MAG TPA: GntR family transcriptional regulator [Alcaligenes sp.]|nr:GntR family transcriptional regulator [Alcaligenes sp.]HRL26675.1 GntR family transcriptional regulator [Alcaligenes sp.]